MSIIKGKNNIVAGFGGTKRCIGEVYFSQSGLASDNPGALPGWTGEYYENGKTLFPDLYNFVKAHSELQVTKAQYDSAIATYGECPKYVVDENGGGGTGTAYKITWAEPSAVTSIVKTQTPQVGDIVYKITDFSDEPYDLSSATQYTIEAVAYSSSGSLSSITINSAAMSVRKLRTVSVTGLPTTAGTSLRLPKLANYIKMANSAEGITQSKAGLPEIRSFVNTAAGNPSYFSNLPSYARAIPNTAGYSLMTGSTISSATNLAYVENYASLDDSIYGSSGTVTPAHTTLYPWIVSFTAAVPASTAQAAEFTGALSGKANTDLSNVPTGYDYVVESQVNTNGSWYRKYKSGWLEQGNSSPTGDLTFTLNKTINFPKPFADNTYMLVGPGFYIANAGAQHITRTATGFTTSSVQNPIGCAYWYACGQGAED